MLHEKTPKLGDVLDKQLGTLQRSLNKLFEYPLPDKTTVVRKLDVFAHNQYQIIQRFKERLLSSNGSDVAHIANPTLTAQLSPSLDDTTRTAYSTTSRHVQERMVGRSDVASTSVMTSSLQDYSFWPQDDLIESDLYQGIDLTDGATHALENEHLMTLPLSLNADHVSHNDRTQASWSDAWRLQAPLPQQSAVREPIAVIPAKRKSTNRCPQHVKGKRRRLCEEFDKFDIEISPVISGHLDGLPRSQKGIVCKFYGAIGSPDALTQTQTLFTSTENRVERCVNYNTSNVSDIMSSLDRIDKSEQFNGFQRRMWLMRLYRCFKDILAELKQARSNHSQGKPPKSDKLSSLARDKLMLKAFPDIEPPLQHENPSEWRDKYWNRRRKLENRLNAAKPWDLAAERFGMGIIALVPTGGEYRIQNSRYETIYEASYEVLFKLLEAKDGGFVVHAAQYLTPFVQELYQGIPLSTTFDIQYLKDLYTQLASSAANQEPPYRAVT